MAEAKKRQKNKKTLRTTIKYLLNCLDRNISSINLMLDMNEKFPLSFNETRQPHVRPIVRGKQGKKVEFGSKLGLSLANGFVKAETLSWDAYNESTDLTMQAEAYKSLYGYYPELILSDKIYTTNQNRKWCKDRKIRLSATPKGRPTKLSAYQKAKRKKEFARRNHIEGKIGQSKQGYKLNQIKAKLKSTSESWIGMTLFVANVVKFAELHNFSL